MASLYQRFSGKINTSRSFPVPPEASHLLGAQCNEEDGAAAKTPRPLQQESSRPRFQYQPRSDCEEEDLSDGDYDVFGLRETWHFLKKNPDEEEPVEPVKNLEEEPVKPKITQNLNFQFL